MEKFHIKRVITFILYTYTYYVHRSHTSQCVTCKGLQIRSFSKVFIVVPLHEGVMNSRFVDVERMSVISIVVGTTVYSNNRVSVVRTPRFEFCTQLDVTLL